MFPVKTKKKPQASMPTQDMQLDKAWAYIPIVWPQHSIIASNPLKGFETLDFENAIKEGGRFLQRRTLPTPMETVNAYTIKWIQLLLDQGQAKINPFRHHTRPFSLWLSLIRKDSTLLDTNKDWLETLPHHPETIIKKCLQQLHIPTQNTELFLTLQLTTLPGWSGFVRYLNEWQQNKKPPLSKVEYMAMRLLITSLLWPEAILLLQWHKEETTPHLNSVIESIKTTEKRYKNTLKNTLLLPKTTTIKNPILQCVFCIDVRSEGIRYTLEKSGPYETFGFAGFFGLPIHVKNSLTNTEYDACPVLLPPQHNVSLPLKISGNSTEKRRKFRHVLHATYKHIKYAFTTPFVLVESLGIWSGLIMTIKNFLPLQASILTKVTQHSIEHANGKEAIKTIPHLDQIAYAKGFLHTIGLTKDFAPLVMLCGHESRSENNAFASALDCGACAGNSGSVNALLMAHILNTPYVRQALAKDNIHIPKDTLFVGGIHNTTLDSLSYINDGTLTSAQKESLDMAIEKCHILHHKEQRDHKKYKSSDWSQVRPEWGLSRNASFIIGPRTLTRSKKLHNRSFLHSYTHETDTTGEILEAILTAPAIVAQWINAQYLFSSIDNVAYGAGSKVTTNITGRFGIIQGNGSDLMYGLPLQSLYYTDEKAHHKAIRLTIVAHAPLNRLLSIIKKHENLQQLLKGKWIFLWSLNPEDNNLYELSTDLTWVPIS